MNQITDTSRFALLAGEAGFDPIEERLRTNVRATIEAVFEEELASFLGRLRYGRSDGPAKGYRHGHRERQLTGTFGTETVRVPRARIEDDTGKVTEWRSKALPRYQRLTKKAEALIAAVYLAGTNTRRVKRALFGLFEGAVSKDVVSRAWRKVKVDRDAWCARDLAGETVPNSFIATPLFRSLASHFQLRNQGAHFFVGFPCNARRVDRRYFVGGPSYRPRPETNWPCPKTLRNAQIDCGTGKPGFRFNSRNPQYGMHHLQISLGVGGVV